MRFLGSKKKKEEFLPLPVTSSERTFNRFTNPNPYSAGEMRLFEELKINVPVISAAISKIVRLTGEFYAVSKNDAVQNGLNSFISGVRVNGTGIGIQTFLSIYLEQLLTYGTAVGEMVVDEKNYDFIALYNTSLENVSLKTADNPLDVSIAVKNSFGAETNVANPALILTSALNPQSSSPYGVSILKGLPFVSDILMKIYKSIGKNWDRVGDIRFAVTYKPEKDASQRAFSRQRAEAIANEWGKAMNPANGVSDFIAVGDVDVKVIGADNQILDSSVPVRQLMEQIVAKLGIPPFLLGLSWSTTERMSSQQADILTSELDSYRRLLCPIIRKICDKYMHLNGYADDYGITWKHINLQDEVEMAKARLTNAQAEKIEIENLNNKSDV